METNESILTREIVSIDDRKKMGKIKDLCIDCDTRAVSHYVVTSATTNSPLVLPFEKSLAVGDTFMTIQNREDFLITSAAEATKAISEAFRLVGTEVFSKAGNRLGTIESYEFDPVFGKITKINLGKRNFFEADTFVFFAPDFVFVDDGVSTAYDLRNGAKDKRKASAKSPFKVRKARKVVAKPTKDSVKEVISSTEEAAEQSAAFESAGATAAIGSAFVEVVEDASPEVYTGISVEEFAVSTAEVSADDSLEIADDLASEPRDEANESDEDAVLREFLVGATLVDNVTSKDGVFSVEKGTVLTKELIDEAQAHDALLLLTMSVDA